MMNGGLLKVPSGLGYWYWFTIEKLCVLEGKPRQ